MSAPFVRFCRELPRRPVARIRSFRRDTGAAVAVIVAIMAPVLVGSMGLGGEAGYWYLKQRSLQNAADVAAHASAVRLAAGDDSGSLRGVAEYIAERSEIDLTNADLELNQPPVSGAFIEDGNAVEVVVTETVPRLFSAIYSNEPIEIAARAVATAQGGGTGCVLALSETAQGAIKIAGSSSTSLTLCDMISNAQGVSFQMQGNGSSVSANCIQTVGTAVTTGGLSIVCEKLRENARPVADPFASVPEPSPVGTCQSGSLGQNNRPTEVTPLVLHPPSGLPSMCFSNGLDVRGRTHFKPGLYIIQGGEFRINSNAEITGDGVVFYLDNGVQLNWNGTASIKFTPPTSGPYAGIIIFGSRLSTSVSHLINGNASSTLDGAVYMPKSHVTWSGNAQTSSTGCTQIIGNTIEFTGNGSVSIHCQHPAGSTIAVAGEVRLVE